MDESVEFEDVGEEILSRNDGQLAEFFKIYSLAERAYKNSQTVLRQIDDKIHNEFRYCSRALKETLYYIHSNSPSDKITESINKAIHAAKNAFNDSIDLIVGYTSIIITELADIDTGKELTVYIPNLSIILDDLKYVSGQIALSRQHVDNRIDIYENLLDSEQFKRVNEFCTIIPVVRNNISVDYGREVKASRRFIITTGVGIIGIILAVVGVVEKAPDFAKYLSNYYPSLSIFLPEKDGKCI